MTLSLRSLGDEVIEQPSTPNARLDVILLTSEWVKEERCIGLLWGKDSQRTKSRNIHDKCKYISEWNWYGFFS